MKTTHDLSQLNWNLAGWMPHLWEFQPVAELGQAADAQVVCPARVPGSVQYALRAAGLLPDWNVGLNARLCEWVEHRQWMYETILPDEWFVPGRQYHLNCLGLDYSGRVLLNGQAVGTFCGTHVPHVFDVTPHLSEKHNVLRIVFDPPPRWLGQFGHTSQMTEWKVRFNYTWDWVPRLVQIGIWDAVHLAESNGQEIAEFRCTGDADPDAETGILHAQGQLHARPGDRVRVALAAPGSRTIIREETVPATHFNRQGLTWRNLPVELWWPNLAGDRPLYEVRCSLQNQDGMVQDSVVRRTGFRHISWQPCEGAPEAADPWICVVNGRPTFLQGVNFPPILPNFADATEERYRKLLTLYRDLGMNVLRINACGYLEQEVFYDLCDELGLLVWQEFPLTSSGVDNVPPSDAASILAVGDIARSFIVRRQHHPSLLLWSGGNELVDKEMHPFGTEHPMLAHLQQVAQAEDPTRRFIPASPSGPRFGADAKEFGQGLHWDVHGPWKVEGSWDAFEAYYAADDALFRSEIGAPGAAPAEVIRRYAGDCNPSPINTSNPFWHNPIGWWLEDKAFAAEHGRAPESLEEYVAWSQARQARALTIAVGSCKARFPRCGGAILWCGHDCFPCPTNTSIVDFHGEPKPAALALAEIYHAQPSAGRGTPSSPPPLRPSQEHRA